MEPICVKIRDGKILIAHKGKPFFPEPLGKDVVVLDQEEAHAFLLGPYPEQNTMILPFQKYNKMMMELRNKCPNAHNWRITALVFIGMFVILCATHLHQWAYSKNIYTHFTKKWKHRFHSNIHARL